jgi:hypothetical protein
MSATNKGFANLDDEEFQPGEMAEVAKIDHAGIHHDIVFSKAEIVSFGGKKDKSKTYMALKLEFTNPEGLTHIEQIFEPASDPDDITWNADKWGKVPGKEKREKIGSLTNQEMVQVLNNDVVYFLLDLAEALGHSFEKAKTALVKANTFKELCELFIKGVPAGNDKKRISMKLLWENNKKKQTSYLKLKGLLDYYPFMADKFDTYVKDRNTVLFINDYESKTRMRPEYDNSKAPAAGSGVSGGSTSGDTYKAPSAQTAGSAAPGSDDDPF